MMWTLLLTKLSASHGRSTKTNQQHKQSLNTEVASLRSSNAGYLRRYLHLIPSFLNSAIDRTIACHEKRSARFHAWTLSLADRLDYTFRCTLFSILSRSNLFCLQFYTWYSNWENVGHVAPTPSCSKKETATKAWIVTR